MELSGFEMIMIFLIALVVLGPDQLIKHAVTAGRFIGKMRTQFNNFKIMTQEEFIKRAEIQDLKELKNSVEKMGTSISHSVESNSSVIENTKVEETIVNEKSVEDSLLNLGKSKVGPSESDR